MTKTSFIVEDDMLRQIEGLKTVFHVRTNSEALQKAIELATLIGRRADEANNVIIASKNDVIKLDLAK